MTWPQPPDVDSDLTLTKVCHGTLSEHRVVRARADGTVTYASNGTTTDASAALWLTLAAGVDGDTIRVQATGEVTEPSWTWVVGSPIFLGVNGTLTQVPPSAGFMLQVASCVHEPTTIHFDPATPVVL